MTLESVKKNIIIAADEDTSSNSLDGYMFGKTHFRKHIAYYNYLIISTTHVYTMYNNGYDFHAQK